ncbi:MAG: hypothetical protein LBR31_06285 [Desulfovibrio sp.]|jgi:hypothetical protein|nr:hypothetical protein [Desulfovibrio sp.]
MPENADLFGELVHSLALPLSRLLAGLSAGLMLAGLLESLNWARFLAAPTRPLARLAHLGEVSGAAFALAFAAPAAANSLLAHAHSEGRISGRELTLANLFNSLPAYLMHTPSIFLLAWPALGRPAAVYVGLTLLAAAARTGFTIALGALTLPAPQPAANQANAAPRIPHSGKRLRETFQDALGTAWRRFTRRLVRLVLFTVPIYTLMYVLQRTGQFALLEAWLSAHIAWLGFLKPEAASVIALHLAAEFGAALGAAGFALQHGALSPRDIVLALMAGNILSTPVRALRHQLPVYSGIFRPALALKLVCANQALRAASMIVMTALYYYCTL